MEGNKANRRNKYTLIELQRKPYDVTIALHKCVIGFCGFDWQITVMRKSKITLYFLKKTQPIEDDKF